MLNSNFVITLVTILAALVCLFQGEIKEAYSFTTPDIYGTYPADGMVKKPGFGPWGGNGIQLSVVPAEKIYDPRSLVDFNKQHRKIGYDFNYLDTPRIQKSYVEKFNESVPHGNMVEANRNLTPMVGGPPRFMPIGPKLNHYAPVDGASVAVDTDNPIVNYGCGDVYSATGQLLKKSPSFTRENYDDAQVKLPSGMIGMYGKTEEHYGQPITIDRGIYANTKSRLRKGGDMFRGDLRIAPISRGYFDVPVSINNDTVVGYFAQHDARGKEVPEICTPLGVGDEYKLSHGRDHDLRVSYGTDVSADSNGL